MSKVIFKNSLFNLIGIIFPIIIGLVSIPFLLNKIGSENLGILYLIWALIGYTGLFDLGIGKGLIQLIGFNYGKENNSEIGRLIFTSFIISLSIGLVFVLVSFYFSKPISQIQSISYIENLELIVKLLGLSTIPTLLISLFRSIMEARSFFLIINIIKIPNNIWLFISPVVLVLMDDFTISNTIILIIIGKMFFLIVYILFFLKKFKKYLKKLSFKYSTALSILNYGGWISVINILNPLIAYFDRFIIISLISATAVTIYITPYELSTKVWIIPGAISSVLYPLLSTDLQNNKNLISKYFQFEKINTSIVLPILIFIIFFSEQIIDLWLGKGFSDESNLLLSIFSIGVFFSSLGHFPLTLLYSNGDFKNPAILNLIIALLYPIIFYFSLLHYNLIGGVTIWLFKTIVDYYIISKLSSKYIDNSIFSNNTKFSLLILLITFILELLINNIFIEAILFMIILFFSVRKFKLIFNEAII